MRNEDGPQSLRGAVAAFIDAERAPFQPKPDERARIWFAHDSGVNSWSLVYAQDGALGYIAFDQG